MAGGGVRGRQVSIVVADEEWGAGLGLSTSSESSDDFYANRRSSGSAKGRAAGRGSRAPREVEVQAAAEWGGGLGLSDSDSDAEVGGRRAQDERRRRIAAATRSALKTGAGSGDGAASPTRAQRRPMFALEVESHTVEVTRRRGDDGETAGPRRKATDVGERRSIVANLPIPICPEMKVLGWAAYSSLHVLDFGFRLACLLVWSSLNPTVFAVEAVLMASGAAMSIYITFHDADVLLLLSKQPTCGRRLAAFALCFVVLGCLQVIQVKRAWSRQVQSAEALFELGVDRKRGKRRPDAMPSFAGAERIMPVALFTGIPFLLVNHIWEDRPCRHSSRSDLPRLIVMAANMFIAMTVSLGIADLDYEVSHHIWKRYHLRHGAKFRNLKKLFPVLHKSFRAVEVYFRMNVIIGFIEVCRQWRIGQELLILAPILDYLIGVVLLNWESPDRERTSVHLIAACGAIFVDPAHFVDRQNFAAPARRISRYLLAMRSLEFLFVAVCLVAIVYVQEQHVEAGTAICRQVDWREDVLPLLASASLYYSMRYFFPLRRLGDDLHTAACRSDLKRLKQLLAPDANGQVRDVNARSKDSRGMTPLMYAAESGRTEAIVVLLEAGASVEPRTDGEGNTCLHFAASRCQIEACRLLVTAGADPRMTNSFGQTPWMLVPRVKIGSRRLENGDPETFGSGLSDRYRQLRHILDDRRLPPDPSVGHDPMLPRRTAYQVTAAPTPGLHLHNLFPEVEKDDTPSPRVLLSVSALVVSRAAGSLARRVLARQDESGGGVPLGALRRVRELGKGGFGRVIEVELPRDASWSIWGAYGAAQAPARYALKLQLKRDQRQAQSEVLALRRAAHPFIVHLERAFSFDRFLALLLELCPTDLNRKLCDPDDSGKCLGLSAFDAARYIGQILLALAFLHKEEQIVFRDVKPENVLISMQDEAKLTDFGLAKVVTSAQRMTMCGTAGFLPPECTASGVAAAMHSLLQSEDEEPDSGGESSASGISDASGRRRSSPFKIDTYALGVTLQLTLLGEDGGRKRDIQKKGPMMLPLHHTEDENTAMLAQLRDNDQLSHEAFALLTEHLLCDDVRRRGFLTDPKVMNHPFFLNELSCSDLQERLIRPIAPEVQPTGMLGLTSMTMPFLSSLSGLTTPSQDGTPGGRRL